MLRDNSQRAELAMKVFWAIAFVNVIALISGYLEYDLLMRIQGDGDFTDTEIDSNDLRQGLIAIAQTVLYIASMVIFIQWFRRSYYNIAQVKNVTTENDDAGALWAFVIPIYNLYRPYRIAVEILEKTVKYLNRNKPETRLTYSKAILGFWWACFLISNFINRIAFKSGWDGESLEELTSASIAYMFADGFDVIGVIVTAYMIKYMAGFESILFLEANAELLEDEQKAEEILEMSGKSSELKELDNTEEEKDPKEPKS